MALIVAQQVIIIFLLVFTGIFCARKGLLTMEATRVYSNFLMVVVLPVMAVNQFIRPGDPQLIGRMGIAVLLSALSNGLAVGVAALVIRKRPHDPRYRTERLAAAYPNAGFMAFPVLLAVLGEEGLLYGAIFSAIFIVFTWTFGVAEATGERQQNLRGLMLNPGILATAVGFFIFLLAIPVPEVVQGTVRHIANLNTPLAMIITGVFLAQLNVKQVFGSWRVYLPVLVKNLLMPLLMVGVMVLLQVASWTPGAGVVALACVISTSCGTAASVIMLTTRANGDASYAAGLVAVSTLFCLVTMPLVVLFANYAIG